MHGIQPSFLASLGLLAFFMASPASAAAPATRPAGVAIVELFTSEGCSSCPPADDLLATLVDEAAKQGTHVYPLSFHVDYWDNLGWADRFASAAFSQRQRAYASLAASRQVYTPQMIVNGTGGFVGSDEREAKKQIVAALATPAAVTVELIALIDPKSPADKRLVKIQYAVEGSMRGARLSLAVVERGLKTEVKRGENARRSLRHENIVRAFVELDVKENKGSAELTLPPDLKAENAQLIGYVQDLTSMQVRGAASTALK